ncbi:MAG: serine/threonine-protein kinase [Dehalococcoidia bacterium]
MPRVKEPRVVGGRYRVLRLLGRGAMSEVWLAHDDRLERDIALKFLEPGPSLTADFQRETGILSGLRHPNIVTVYDADEEDERRYIVMECVDGVSLRDHLLANGPLAPSEAARIGASVSAALAYAHSRGVLHNDVKPENILIEREGEARLTDFGAATITGATLDAEGAAQVMGTIAYVAPEVLQGASPTPASDIYALATTLFEAVSGRLPYDGPSNAAIAGQKLSATPARLGELTAVPGAFERLVSAALSPTASGRPSAEDIERALGPLASEPALATAGVALEPASRRPTQRLAASDGGRGGHRGLIAVGGVLGALLVVAGAIALTSRDDSPGDEQPNDQLNAAVTTPTAEATATPTPLPPTQAEPSSGQDNRGGDDDDDDEKDDKDEDEPDDKPGRGRGR